MWGELVVGCSDSSAGAGVLFDSRLLLAPHLRPPCAGKRGVEVGPEQSKNRGGLVGDMVCALLGDAVWLCTTIVSGASVRTLCASE